MTRGDRASEYWGVSLRAAELQQHADTHRPVRAGRVASADDSLMTIMLKATRKAASRGTLLRGVLVFSSAELWL